MCTREFFFSLCFSVSICFDSQLKLRFVWHLCARLFSLLYLFHNWKLVCVEPANFCFHLVFAQCSHSSNRSTFFSMCICLLLLRKIVVVVTWSRRSLWKWAFCTQYLTISHIKESLNTRKKKTATNERTNKHRQQQSSKQSLSSKMLIAQCTWNKIYGDLNEIWILLFPL